MGQQLGWLVARPLVQLRPVWVEEVLLVIVVIIGGYVLYVAVAAAVDLVTGVMGIDGVTTPLQVATIDGWPSAPGVAVTVIVAKLRPGRDLSLPLLLSPVLFELLVSASLRPQLSAYTASCGRPQSCAVDIRAWTGRAMGRASHREVAPRQQGGALGMVRKPRASRNAWGELRHSTSSSMQRPRRLSGHAVPSLVPVGAHNPGHGTRPQPLAAQKT